MNDTGRIIEVHLTREQEIHHACLVNHYRQLLLSDRSEDGYRCCDVFPQVLVIFYRIDEKKVERYAFSRIDGVGKVRKVVAGQQIIAIVTHGIDFDRETVIVRDGEVPNIPIMVKPQRVGIDDQITLLRLGSEHQGEQNG